MNLVRREEFEAQHKMVLENKKRLDAISGDVKKKSGHKAPKQALTTPSKKAELVKKSVKKTSSDGKSTNKKAINTAKKPVIAKKTTKK